MRLTAVSVTGRRVGSVGAASPAEYGAPIAFRALNYPECARLLRSRRLGRVAFGHDAWPLILPVNYVFDEPNVVIRTGTGAKLESMPMTAVAFEIDDADPNGAWGWSVVVQGPAFDITDALDDYSTRLRRSSVKTWAPGERNSWLKITAVHVSGRAFGV